jgi:hypothetical protein
LQERCRSRPAHDAGGQVFSSRNATNSNDLDGILGKIGY